MEDSQTKVDSVQETNDSADLPSESRVWNVSTRALITLMIVVTACSVELIGAWQALQAKEPVAISSIFQNLVLLAIGWYFGQKGINTK